MSEPNDYSPAPEAGAYSSSRDGGGLGLVLFLAIVAASVAIFFLFTYRSCRAAAPGTAGAGAATGTGAGETAVPGAGSGAETPAGAGETPAVPGTPGTPGTPDVPAAPPAPTFADPGAVVTALEATIRSGELDKLAPLFAATADGATQAKAAGIVFGKLAGELGFGLPDDGPASQQLGQSGDAVRYALGLESATGDPHEVLVDTRPQGDQSWRISRISFPDVLKEAVVTGVAPVPDPAAAAIARAEQDSLQVSADFVRSVVALDYEAARAICDFDRVSGEKIAALCFVFEEGDFKLREEKPIVVTASNPDSSWAIARVESGAWGSSAEFGIEMHNELPEGGGDPSWQVVGINFSELLSTYADASAAGKIAYTPMVTSPMGGESLALYFEYNIAALHPRAQRQLEIVAEVLKGDSSKELKITGHADALGSEDYNLELSRERAANVRAFLAAHGVPASQIVTVAAGEGAPLKPNLTEAGEDNPDGRAHNRRAEIFLDF